MGKKILISENMEDNIINMILNEEYFYPNPDKVLLIKKYLDETFIKSTVPDVSGNGMPTKRIAVSFKGNTGQMTNTMSLHDIFYMLQEKFKNIENDKYNRDKLLKQVIADWVNNKISREGGLSVNYV